MSDASPVQPELRPMGIGDILDTAFRLYREHFVPFLTISLIVYVPYTALMLILSLALGGAPETDSLMESSSGDASLAASVLRGLGTLLFFLVVWPLVQGAMVYHISASFLGEQITAGEAYRRAAGRLLSLLGTQILVGLVVILGFLLLIVPGIIFSLWFMLVMPIVLLETLAGSRAMSRSRELMKGNLGKGFMLGLVVGLLNTVVVFMVGTVVAMIGISNPAWIEAATNLAGAVLLPILIAPSILLYYDLRIRKEAFDLERLSAALGGTEQTP